MFKPINTMKKILLLFTSLFAWFGQGIAQIIPFIEVPDSLNPFMDLPGNLNLEIADIDYDGLDDVLLYSGFSTVHQFKSLGDFEFEEIDFSDSELQNSITLGEQYFNDSLPGIVSTGSRRILLADIDSDGDTDLHISSQVSDIYGYNSCGFYYSSERIHLNFLNNGTGVLEFNSLIEQTCNESVREFTDWDEDGDLDLVSHIASKYYNSTNLLLFDDVNQTFEAEPISFIIDNANFHIHDVNGDGFEDITTRDSLRIKSGAGEFHQPISNVFPLDLQFFAYKKDFGDIDNDGNQEYLVYDSQAAKWRFFTQNCAFAIPETPCYDGMACTINQVWDENCNCIGIFIDADNDGICDDEDQTNGDCMLGDSCDDGNDTTFFDELDENCECFGTPCIGLPCDDGEDCTTNDQYDENCNCIGTPTAGIACDDGEDCTINDQYDEDCNCSGIESGDSDMDGICDAQDQTNGDCTLGEPCEDNDECTANEFLDENCECNIGFIFPDADEDGVCDQFDQCPGLDDNLDADNDGTPDCLETVGLEEILESQVNIFPNPSSGELFIETELKISQVKMYNAIGEEMPIFYTQNNNLDLSYYSNGLYLIELHSEKGLVRKRVYKN